jgi:type I restriction enzyme M protein
VRAHLYGGIPVSEVEAKRGLFAAHGLDPSRLLERHAKASGYFDFTSPLPNKADLRKLIEGDEGVVAQEQALAEAVEGWWKKHKKAIAELPATNVLMKTRASLLSSFEKAVGPVGLLDRFQVAGVVATWWGDVQNDLRTIVARGFVGLVETWEVSILTALADDKTKTSPLEHRFVKRLLPEYLASLAELEAKKAELEATLKGASDGDDEEGDGASEDEAQLSEEEKTALKKQLAAAKRALKAKQEEFAHKLKAARDKLEEPAARDLVLGILRADLDTILSRYVARHRQAVVAAFETWWDKYRVTLSSIEEERDAAAARLRRFLREVGYDA